MTSRATTSAFTLPFGPMVRQLFVVRLSFPSTTPSTKRSSLPVTSPLILIPWLIHAAAGDALASPPDSGGVLAGTPPGGKGEIEGRGGAAPTPSGFDTSVFPLQARHSTK